MSDWRERAACKGVDTDIFFPRLPTGANKGAQIRTYAEPLSYCARCPVVDECLEWVLSWETSRRDGVFGDTTPLDRRKMHERSRSQAS